LAITASPPTTRIGDRGGLLVTATLVLIAGVIWFAFVPRRAFPRGRIFVAATIAQAVMVIMLGITSGASSVYFPYYLLPVLVMVLSGSLRQSVAVGALGATGLIGLALAAPYSDLERDVAVTRLLELATMTCFAAATALA